MNEFWQRTVVEPLRQLGEQMMTYLPKVFAALVLLVAGLILGWVVKQAVYRLLRLLRFDHLANRMGLAQVIERVGLSRGTSYVVGQFAGLFVVLVAVILALNALGPTGSNLVQQFFIFLPQLLIAVLILVVGGILAAFFGRGTLIAAVNARLASARLLAGAVRVFIWLLAAIVALEHLGIGGPTLAITFGVIFGGIVTGIAIAFGMAGKDLARQALDSLVKRSGTEEDETGVRHL